MDLLSVVAHELGHKLGLDHSHDEHDLMASTLRVGELPLTQERRPRELLFTNWAATSSLEADAQSPSVVDILPLREGDDALDVPAHERLFAGLDDAPAKPGSRNSESTHETASRANEEDLLAEDLIGAIALARLTAGKHY